MAYESAVAQLLALGHELHRTPAHKFDLAHMRVLLHGLGDPQQRFKSVLIAGTNGKGSTAATLASIVQAAGHRTGLYTSPHLVRVNERIRVDGALISDADFADVHSRAEGVAQKLVDTGELPWHPSFFEMLTAMAFLHFAQSQVEVAVLEVGMGGRLDATNVVDPTVAVITDVSLDHQKFLGNTVAEIAREKAGIIHRGGVVVMLPQHPQANDVIGHAIVEQDATGISAVQYVPPVSPGTQGTPWDQRGAATGRNRYPLTVMGEEITVDSPLAGRHQLRNVALAIAAAEQLNVAGVGITARHIEHGIAQTSWPGRFQVIAAAANSPEIVMDVAHNPAGAWALRAALSERYEGRPITLLFAVLRDKAIDEITGILFPLADTVIATKLENPRSAMPHEIAAAATRTGADVMQLEDFDQAMENALGGTGPGAVLVITGSIYLVGEASQWLRQRGILRT